MIYSVNGTVDLIEPNLAVIDCGGVGYACRTTANTLSQLKIGEKAKLMPVFPSCSLHCEPAGL